MSQNILHLLAATRLNSTSVIVGDRAALGSLRAAIDDALRSGSGGTSLYASDGEPHDVAVVLESDMDPVYTTYAFEANPARSRRETVPIDQLESYREALDKAAHARWEPGPCSITGSRLEQSLRDRT